MIGKGDVCGCEGLCSFTLSSLGDDGIITVLRCTSGRTDQGMRNSIYARGEAAGVGGGGGVAVP